MYRDVRDITADGVVVRMKREYIADALTPEGYRVPPHKRGAVMFADICFPPEMTDAEVGKLARLAKLMIADSNMIGYRGHGGIKPYTRDDICALVGLSGKRGREFVCKMITLGVMAVVTRRVGDIEREEYYINPAYFFAGKRISLNLYLLFRESLDPILPAWVRREFWSAAQQRVAPLLAGGDIDGA